MMLRKTIHVPLCTLLSGLMLAACGGVPEAGLAPAEESLGTTASALCSGQSVTSLTLGGMSLYQGEVAGSGDWAVSSGANAVRLEYYVDGSVRGAEERCNASGGTSNCTGSGPWYFSSSGISCGTHNVEVRAYPMVIDSAGNRSTCLDSPRSLFTSVYEDCGTPSVSLICGRYSSTTIRCAGYASGGTGTYTGYWKKNWLSRGYSSGWYQDVLNQFFPCSSPRTGYPSEQMQYQLKVIDSAGRESTIQTSSVFSCEVT